MNAEMTHLKKESSTTKDNDKSQERCVTTSLPMRGFIDCVMNSCELVDDFTPTAVDFGFLFRNVDVVSYQKSVADD